MGMGLQLLVQPDLLDGPSESVRFCPEQGLQSGDDEYLGDEGDETDQSWGSFERKVDIAALLPLVALITCQYFMEWVVLL